LCLKESLGTVCPLVQEEKEYFAFMAPIYMDAPLRKVKCVDWCCPPPSWLERYKLLDTRKINLVLESIHLVANEACQNTPRFKWMETLQDLPPGVSRFVWCLMFCKATNGVSDVVVCNHFKLAIQKMGSLSIDQLIAKPVLIAQILRQTSKWAKNTVSTQALFIPLSRLSQTPQCFNAWLQVIILKILTDIQTTRKGVIPLDLKEWIQYHEMGPKTAALLLWSYIGKETTVPVDSHVITCMRAL
jgi:hypothetical protein